MTVMLLANVGNRDVQVTDRTVLPEAYQEIWTPARVLGEELLTHYDRYADALAFPMIGKCIRWLLEEKGVDKTELYVHLFASDQPSPPITPEPEWQKDTVLFARVIDRALKNGLPELAEPNKTRLAGKQVRIHEIRANPAYYHTMLEFFTDALTYLDRYVHRDDVVYLEVAGGTPAMTSMLIVAGVDAFGAQVHPLYLKHDLDRPFEIDVGRWFFRRRARADLQAQLDLYAYTTARATVDRDRDLIAPDTETQALISALLTYGERRLAFDFRRAGDALDHAAATAPVAVQPEIDYRRRELQTPDRAALLAELIHSTRIKYETGDYADFTQRLFRFQESSLRHLALEMGMVCKDENCEFVDMDWAHAQPGLIAYLDDYVFPDGRRDQVKINGRSLNRVSLGAIVDFYIENDEAWTDTKEIVDKLRRLSSVAKLRNKGLAGHGFEGIGRADLAEAFGESPDEIVPLLETIYRSLFDRTVGESPYDAVNTLIGDLLDG